MLKYYLQYYDTENVLHRCEIYDDSYESSAIEIYGSVIVTYTEVDDVLEVLRSKSLRVSLSADTTLTFEDLWSENEKTFLVRYYRNYEQLFVGWLNSDGFFEDFVSDKWIVSFDCIDGLGYLKDLAFVQESGFPYLGKMTQLDVISKALQRTGIEQDILVKIDIFYNGTEVDTGTAYYKNILAETYVNSERFIEDDEETYMSCDKVIRDILQPYSAILVNRKGKWVICKPNELYNGGTFDFYRYDFEGTYIDKQSYSFGFTLGSHINGFYPHHANKNQRIENESSLGALRISYKYGLVSNLLNNAYLKSDAGVIDGYTIVDGTYLNIPASELGVEISVHPTNASSNVLTLTSDAVTVLSGVQLRPRFKFLTTDDAVYCYFHVKLDDGVGGVYYLKFDGTWQTTLHQLVFTNRDIFEEFFEVISEVTPVAGNVTVSVYQPTPAVAAATYSGYMYLTEVQLFLENANALPDKGEFHTFQRTTNPSAKVNDVIEVYTGDNATDLFVGTLYKSDADTPTETWTRLGYGEELPILGLMGYERLRLNQLPKRIFSGDIYGYFDYLDIISIAGISGKFMPIRYEYDTLNNIISASFKQIHSGEIEDVDYEITIDYGRTVKPTIR